VRWLGGVEGDFVDFGGGDEVDGFGVGAVGSEGVGAGGLYADGEDGSSIDGFLRVSCEPGRVKDRSPILLRLSLGSAGRGQSSVADRLVVCEYGG